MATSIMRPMFLPFNPNNYLCSIDNMKCFKQCHFLNSRKSTDMFKAYSSRITPPEPSSRRSGNYNPPLWDFDNVQSLKSQFTEERYSTQASRLKMQVKIMLESAKELIDQLEFIDDLQRLGISCHFEITINKILTRIYEQSRHDHVRIMKRDLYITSLEFRLLRQHGFRVSQELFNCFKNEKGEFESRLRDDTKGLLQLYEASQLLIEGEETLEMARQFATVCLTRDDDSLMVRAALEIPFHWRVERQNIRWLIDEYEKRPNMSHVLLEFAKLDFNIVQAMHQEELKQASSWWNGTCLAEHLPFARDRIVECYFWTTGVLSEHEYGYSRIMATKVNAFILILDDIYDVHGTLEELQLFTNIIQRWDIEDINQLPNYMQIYFLALNNFVNEMAYDVLKDQGFVTIPYLRKSWIDLCKAFLQEAEWYFAGYQPSMEEYINTAWISSSVPVMLTHAFFLVANPIEKESVECLYKYHNIIQWPGMIFRLANDLGTSPDEMKRGDVPKCSQCYMNETGADEKEAEEYVRSLISEAWKKMNEVIVEAQSSFPREFIRSAANLGRMAHYMYHNGDGLGTQNVDIKNRISRLLFEPINLKSNY